MSELTPEGKYGYTTSEEQVLVRKIADRIERRRMNQNSIDLALLILIDIREAFKERNETKEMQSVP